MVFLCREEPVLKFRRRLWIRARPGNGLSVCPATIARRARGRDAIRLRPACHGTRRHPRAQIQEHKVKLISNETRCLSRLRATLNLYLPQSRSLLLRSTRGGADVHDSMIPVKLSPAPEDTATSSLGQSLDRPAEAFAAQSTEAEEPQCLHLSVENVSLSGAEGPTTASLGDLAEPMPLDESNGASSAIPECIRGFG